MATKPNLDEILLKEVSRLYDRYNRYYFKGKLTKPIFVLMESKRRIGYWCAENNEISISRCVMGQHSNWYKVKIVLKHEMAHQYVSEVLGISHVAAHGKLFKQIAQEKEFESLLEIEESESHEKDSIIDKIQKLLSLANSENQHEAENAVRFANKLMNKWNIKSLDNEDRTFAYRQLGQPVGRRNSFICKVSNILHTHFFVDVIWTWARDPTINNNKWGYVLEILGTPENLEIANYVYDFIVRTSDSLFKQHKKNKGEGTRLNFMHGIASGFNNKLLKQKTTNTENDRGETPTTEDIVWTGDPKLKEYFKKKYPKVLYSQGLRGGNGDGFHAGYDQGKNLTLSHGVSNNNGNAGRLLNA